jgi:RHS repeat-associated protein
LPASTRRRFSAWSQNWITQIGGGKGATTVVNHLIYDAFGKVASESNSAVDSLLLFTGRPFDRDTGFQNNLNRWYDASVGRWLSEDPIGFNGGDANLYRYVGNAVLLIQDGFGLGPKDLTNKMLREACARIYGRGSAFNICCKIVSTLRGKTCNELFRYCIHIRDHRLFGAKAPDVCLTLYNTVCWGE